MSKMSQLDADLEIIRRAISEPYDAVTYEPICPEDEIAAQQGCDYVLAESEIIRRVMNPTKEELLEERIARLYQECNELFVLAANPETVKLFGGEWRELDQAATRLQWTATAVEASIPSKLKVIST